MTWWCSKKGERVGGLLRFGIPDFKLEKRHLDRRIERMSAEGVEFRVNQHVGVNVAAKKLFAEFDAVVLAGGAESPRDLPLRGRGLKGIHSSTALTTSTISAARNASTRGAGRQTHMPSDDTRAVEVRRAWCAEASRIEFLLQRDGAAATLVWVRRTLAIYRRSVLDCRHFAHIAEYRLKFVVACLAFRRWLAANGGDGRRRASAPPSSVERH